MSQKPHIRLAGAAGMVTGSCTVIEFAPRVRILVDLGLVQGTPEQEATNPVLPIERSDWLDAVVITHAHADHCGRLPMLPRHGFVGPIITSPATAALLPMVLHASARLQQRLADDDRRAGHPPRDILFDRAEVDRMCSQIIPLQPGKLHEFRSGVHISLHPVGHILGACAVHIQTGEGSVLVSGDIGHRDAEPMPPPPPPPAADLVVMECTRGDVQDKPGGPAEEQLAAVLLEAKLNDQIIVCPSFAIGRTHQLLYRLGQISRKGTLGMPVMLDSMMSSVTAPLHAEFADQLSAGAQALVAEGIDPLDFPELHQLRSRRAAQVIKDLRGPAIVMAGNGFGEGGPIVEHLIRWLPSRKARVLLAGFCMPGTVSGRLAEDPPKLKLRGQWIAVEAPIDRLNCFSGHADATQLADWLQSMPGPKPKVVLNHGDPGPRTAMQDRLHAHGYEVHMPEIGEAIET